MYNNQASLVNEIQNKINYFEKNQINEESLIEPFIELSENIHHIQNVYFQKLKSLILPFRSRCCKLLKNGSLSMDTFTTIDTAADMFYYMNPIK